MPDFDKAIKDAIGGVVRKSPLGVYTETLDRLGGAIQDGARTVTDWWGRTTDPTKPQRGDIALPAEPKRKARRSGRGTGR